MGSVNTNCQVHPVSCISFAFTLSCQMNIKSSTITWTVFFTALITVVTRVKILITAAKEATIWPTHSDLKGLQLISTAVTSVNYVQFRHRLFSSQVYSPPRLICSLCACACGSGTKACVTVTIHCSTTNKTIVRTYLIRSLAKCQVFLRIEAVIVTK